MRQRTGVLVLAGSSGRVDTGRAEVIGRLGVDAVALGWFGGPGQQPAPYDVPLELFSQALDRLALDCERLAVVGTSFGAEAALLTAARDPRVSTTIAFAPTPVAWAGFGEGRWTSHWTLESQPVPYVPFVDDWHSATEPPAYRDLYARSLAEADPAARAAAAIEVERIAGTVVLVAGGDDQVWPSVDFAEQITARRAAHGLDTVLVTHPDAGHRTLLPGEAKVAGGQSMRRGGSLQADARLGELAWPAIRAALRGPVA